MMISENRQSPGLSGFISNHKDDYSVFQIQLQDGIIDCKVLVMLIKTTGILIKSNKKSA